MALATGSSIDRTLPGASALPLTCSGTRNAEIDGQGAHPTLTGMSDAPIGISPKQTQEWFAAIRNEMSQSVIGQTAMVEQLLLTLLCGEHALLEGVAGTAIWTAVESLGCYFGLTARRFRCSPDLEWNDVVDEGTWKAIWGASLLLVDGFDRLPGKLRNIVQQAMSDRVVDGRQGRFEVADPFVVYATRYRAEEVPQPERIEPYDDRFLFQINVPNPTYHEEYSVAATKSGEIAKPQGQLVSVAELTAWRALARTIEASPSVVHFAVRLARATRVHEAENPDFIYEWVHHGAGPRAAHFLVLSAKARATLYGRAAATHEDIRNVVLPVLRHRILTNRNARANGIDSDHVIRRLLQEAADPQVAAILLDVVIGYGAHPDPAAELAQAVHRAVADAEADDACTGVILTGLPGVFSAGIDTRAVPAYGAEKRAEMLAPFLAKKGDALYDVGRSNTVLKNGKGFEHSMQITHLIQHFYMLI